MTSPFQQRCNPYDKKGMRIFKLSVMYIKMNVFNLLVNTIRPFYMYTSPKNQSNSGCFGKCIVFTNYRSIH